MYISVCVRKSLQHVAAGNIVFFMLIDLFMCPETHSCAEMSVLCMPVMCYKFIMLWGKHVCACVCTLVDEIHPNSVSPYCLWGVGAFPLVDVECQLSLSLTLATHTRTNIRTQYLTHLI